MPCREPGLHPHPATIHGGSRDQEGTWNYHPHPAVTRTSAFGCQWQLGGKSRFLPPPGSNNVVPHLFLPELCQKKPVQAEVLNKVHSLMMPKMSRFQLKITPHSRKQEELKVNEQSQSEINYLTKISKQLL